MKVNTELAQTRISKRAFAEATRQAEEAGISLAAWQRALIQKATGVNGRGRKVKGAK